MSMSSTVHGSLKNLATATATTATISAIFWVAALATAPAHALDPTVEIRGAPDTYAFAVFHDENSNGKLETNVVGIPTEPNGFSLSCDALGNFGPPRFDAAAIEPKADVTLQAALQ